MSASAAASTLFPTTIAGSLPKPAWLAAPKELWAPWRLDGDELAEAKDDATLLALKLQEDAGIDIVGDGEQSRQHFVHGFLEAVEGIDFDRRVEMGIRNNRYKAMCPTVIGPLRLRVDLRDRLAQAGDRVRVRRLVEADMAVADLHEAEGGIRLHCALQQRAGVRDAALHHPQRAGTGPRHAGSHRPVLTGW